MFNLVTETTDKMYSKKKEKEKTVVLNLLENFGETCIVESIGYNVSKKRSLCCFFLESFTIIWTS